MNNNVTIVTGLWDLGRGEINSSFKRTYQHYLDKFAELLKTPANMVIYVAKKDEDFIWQHRSRENTYVRIKELEEFKLDFEFFKQTQDIRSQPEWYLQAGWLTASPQATLEYYNPVVMSKMFLLNDASLYNPFNSEYFYWIDAGITSTVHGGYFHHDMVFDNLETYSKTAGGFLVLSYPYEGTQEIHGFPRNQMENWCGKDPKYVVRGGFFGGSKEEIRELNSTYHTVLQNTINSGFMGTEENILTILAHIKAPIISRYPIGSDGLVWPFFERLKDVSDLKAIPQTIQKKGNKTQLYILGFNSPMQFAAVVESIKLADPYMFESTDKFLINNTTDESMFDEYAMLCNKYGFTERRSDNNFGVCGGRQFVAEEFAKSDADYCIFFEDDMMLNPPSDMGSTCSSGFTKYVPDLLKTVISIMNKKQYDFLKFSFSEFYLNNNIQVSWYNVPQPVRESVWPEYHTLPTYGFDMNSPRTKFSAIEVENGIPYADGEVYYGNWPQIVSKEGNQKMFLDTKWAHPYEQTWMSHMFQLTLENKLKPAILLASPVTHNRFEFYAGELRREN